MKTHALVTKPSAFAPVLMSFMALLVVLLHVILVGTAPAADEGTEAHIWQILMTLQIPVIGFFALKWLPRIPRQAMPILVLQMSAALLAASPVYFLGW